MSLNIGKLKMVRRLEGGVVQAQCPACAEGNHDRTGNHLRIYPDGRFGCCVHPKDGEHRKRIFALVGDKSHLRSAGAFTVRVGGAKPSSPEAQSVAASLTGLLRTLRTAKSESVATSAEPEMEIRTLRTLISEPRACVSEDTYMYKGSETAVLSVLAGERLPYLTSGGTLVIPFDAPERYHWWKGGMHVWETRAEVIARMSENQGED